MLSFFPTIVYGQEYTSAALAALSVGEAVNLGTPVKDAQVLGNSVQTRPDGSTVVYGVTSGPPATLFAYNVDTGELEDQQPLEDPAGGAAKVCYAADLGADGILNLATQGDSLFFRYDPEAKRLKCYGEAHGETAVMTAGYADEAGNYFFGTYPNAKLMQYDKAQDKLIDLGPMLAGEKYVNAVGGYNGKIFMGGRGNPVTQFVKYDTATGKKTVLENPSLPGKFTAGDVGSYHTAVSEGKYLFARVKLNNLNETYMCVFDMESEQWIDFIPGTLHLHPTGFEDGLIYYHSSLGGGKAGLFAYDMEAKTSRQIEGITLSSSDYLVKPKFATLKDQANYPGRTLIAGANSKGIALINLEKRTVSYVKNALPAQANNIRAIKGGYNGDIIVSAYMGAKVVIYDSVNEEIRMEAPSVQIEGISVFDQKYYFGLYGKGRLTEFDPTQPGSDTNPRQIAHMAAYEQDRAFNVADAGTHILWGTYPNYGRLGGAVGVYEKATGKYRVYVEPVEDQAMAGLAFQDGKIYGSTSVYGGLGIDPIDDYAKMFRMDPATGKVEQAADIKLQTDSNRQYFAGDILFDPKGRMWVACAQTLIEVNPEDLSVIREIPVGSGRNTLDHTRALPYRMELGPDGLLYTNIGNRITAVDLDTGETKTLSDSNTIGLTFSSDGTLYYIGSNVNYLYRLELQRQAPPPSAPIPVKQVFTTQEDYTVGDRVLKGLKGIAFATVQKPDGYLLSEYGMVLSETDSLPEIGKPGCFRLQAYASSRRGQFGILFSGLKPSATYHCRPYAVYATGGDETVLYGEAVHFQAGN